MMNQTEYVGNFGAKCPNCASENIEAQTPESDGAVVWAMVSCHDCNATWDENFALLGFSNFKEGS